MNGINFHRKFLKSVKHLALLNLLCQNTMLKILFCTLHTINFMDAFELALCYYVSLHICKTYQCVHVAVLARGQCLLLSRVALIASNSGWNNESRIADEQCDHYSVDSNQDSMLIPCLLIHWRVLVKWGRWTSQYKTIPVIMQTTTDFWMNLINMLFVSYCRTSLHMGKGRGFDTAKINTPNDGWWICIICDGWRAIY